MPKIIRSLGKITPQYWIFDSLERAVLFPNVLIVAFIVIALFIAGSYRLKDFIYLSYFKIDLISSIEFPWALRSSIKSSLLIEFTLLYRLVRLVAS